MKQLISVGGFILGFAFLANAAQSIRPDDAARLARINLPFIENTGQVKDNKVRFAARTFAGAVYVTTDGGVVYALCKEEISSQRSEVSGNPNRTEVSRRRAGEALWRAKEVSGKAAGVAVIREEPVGANAAAICGGGKSAAAVNFFLGRDPAGWRPGAQAFDSVEWRSVYPGIDLSVRAYGNTIEKVFTVAPGADPQEICMAVSGAEQLRVDETGRLVVQTALGEARFSAPVACQPGPQGPEPVAIQYWVAGNRYGFELSDYDISRPLVIDPLLAGTFLGGHRWDNALAMAVDGQDRIYVTGFTGSTDFPITPGAYQTSLRGTDVFISLFDNRLTNLIASTYLGGSGVQTAYAITLDPAGHVYITGDTTSTNFPVTPGAYQTAKQGGETNDAFIAVMDGALGTLLAATYLGGGESEYAETIAFDQNNNNIYVAGVTRSTNFPTTAGAFQRDLKGWGDGFISRLDNGLQNLLASTYLGGSNYDRVNSVKLDGVGAVYVAGITGGNGFPTTNLPYSSTFGGGETDGFVSKLSSNLSDPACSTYIGGGRDDWPDTVIPAATLIYIAGYTYSSNFPVIAGCYQTAFQGGTNDAFIAALDLGLNQLMASTFLGGSDFDAIQAMARPADGTIWIAGYTASSNFPVSPDAYSRTNHNNDAFVARLNSQLTTLGAATLAGGIWDDIGYGLGLDSQGSVFVAGYTESYDFPTSPGAYERFYHVPDQPWYGDAFVIKLDSSLSAAPAPPINVAASDKTYADHIALSWTAADNATNYSVWRGLTPNSGEAAAITGLSSEVTAYNDWNVSPGTAYYYWLKAANATGESAFSDPATGRRSPVCPLAADLDGDAKADPTVVTNGSWYTWLSGAGYARIGPAIGADAGWSSAAADFDGDAKADPTAMSAGGGWYVWFSASGYPRVGPVALGNGNASAVVADFDGDRLGDPAIVSNSTWQIWLSSAGYQPALPLTYGSGEMIPLAADFDGDGYADFARYLNGNWYVWLSSAFYAQVGPLAYGEAGTLPAAADFDGDRLADPAVYKVMTGEWYVWLSSAGYAGFGPFSFHP